VLAETCPWDGQVRQELLDFGSAHVARMALAVEQDELPGPVNVTCFCSRRVVSHPQDLAHLVEQPGRPGPRQLAQVDAQDRAVKQFEGGPRRLQRRQRLFLGSHDVFQKPAHGGAVQLTRMPLAVKQDIGPHPGHQLCGCRLRCAAVAGGLCDLVEQAWRL
jgi:hypothetical protein